MSKNTPQLEWINDYFTIVSDEIIRDPNLSAKAKVIYNILKSYNKAKWCVVGVKKLADHSGFHRSTITDSLKELDKSGWIQILDHPKDKRRHFYKIFGDLKAKEDAIKEKSSAELPTQPKTNNVENSDIVLVDRPSKPAPNNKRPLNNIKHICDLSLKLRKTKYNNSLKINDGSNSKLISTEYTGKKYKVDVMGITKEFDEVINNYPKSELMEWQFDPIIQFKEIKKLIKKVEGEPGGEIIYQGMEAGMHKFEIIGEDDDIIYYKAYIHKKTKEEKQEDIKAWAIEHKYFGIEKEFNKVSINKLWKLTKDAESYNNPGGALRTLIENN